MFMDLHTIQQLTTLIRRSTRTSECQLVLYTGSIAGHICVLAGGGEDAVGPSSPALSEKRRSSRPISDAHVAIKTTGAKRGEGQIRPLRRIASSNALLRNAWRFVSRAGRAERRIPACLCASQCFEQAISIIDALRGRSHIRHVVINTSEAGSQSDS
jgi:hypothetical protein